MMNLQLQVGKLYSLRRATSRSMFEVLRRDNKVDGSEDKYLEYGKIFLVIGTKEFVRPGRYKVSVLVDEKVYKLFYEERNIANWIEVK